MNKKRFLSIQGSFAAAHLYAQKEWDLEKNKAVFGKCFSRFGHGHEYRVRVTIDVTEITEKPAALLEARKVLDSVLAIVDHTHLNFDFTNFSKNIPTTENIAIFIKELWLKEASQNLKTRLVDLSVFENDLIGARP